LTDIQQTQQVREAQSLQRLGRVPEAAAAYERILARWPDLADCWFNLAVLQRTRGRFTDALASYQQALDRGVAKPEEVHLNRGVIFTDHLGQHAAAERELQQALAINPAYIPALLNLANLNEDLGRRPQAIAIYERILVLDPGCLEALARYANAQPAAPENRTLIARLHGAIRLSARAPERASLGFALGRLLDGAGQYAAAFEAYRAANEASRASALPGSAVYDRKRQEELIDELIRSCPPSVSGAAHPPTQPSSPPLSPHAATGPQPIFICGMFRSGSTLAEQLLARHPGVMAGGELDLLPSMAAAISNFPQSLASLSATERAGLAARYTSSLAKVSAGAAQVTDKRPDNFLLIGLIKSLFPAARIVHTTRDPLDNCLSIFFLHLDHRMSYAFDLMDIGHHYRQYRRLMAHWSRCFGEDLLELNYDRFVQAPAVEGARLFGSLGLTLDEKFLAVQPPQTRSPVKTASVWQVREPIYTRSCGRSAHYAAQLSSLREYLSDLLPK